MVSVASGARSPDRAGAVSGPAEASAARSQDGVLVVRLAGRWHLKDGVPSTVPIEKELTGEPPRCVSFDAVAVCGWDTSIITFLTRLISLCGARGIETDRSGLPEGIQRLIALAEAVPERQGARQAAAAPSWLARIGLAVLNLREPVRDALAFVGQITLCIGKLLRGRARYRREDLLLLIQQAGGDAIGIVTLISFLVGTILAFVGAVQLEQFGAAIYVADLVGIAMVRDMGAMMTAIVMAGRTGAAYAAQLGTMKVTQEVDALTTMGMSPLEFLVLPRMIALCLMMPLLCLYADFLGIVGGMVVGGGMLRIAPLVYYNETAQAVHLIDVAGGVFKAAVYGLLVAVSGCLRGMQCGSSASAVGDATTAAVVTSIVLIITACGLFSVIFYVLGI